MSDRTAYAITQHLGERQRRTWFGDGKSVATKKLFYALRPAAALRWLGLHADAPFPPMHFPTLMAECDPPRDVAAMTVELIARKAETRELGEAPLPAVIARFVAEEFAAAGVTFAGEDRTVGEAVRKAFNAVMLKAIAAIKLD